MKYLRTVFILIVLFAVNACQKEELVELNYNVVSEQPFWDIKFSVPKNSDVKFLFSGDAEFITFYSGEPGKEYQYKSRTSLPNGASVSPDKGTPIKGLSDNKMEGHSYKYATAGSFIATFVATNRTVYGASRTVVVNVPVTIAP